MPRVIDFKFRFAVFLFSHSHKANNNVNFEILIVLTARKVFKKIKKLKFLECYTKCGLFKESDIQGLILYSYVLLLINAHVTFF